MSAEIFVHKCEFPIENDRYEIFIYCRPDGSHVAKTVLDANDTIINDGSTLDEVLKKHKELLPLAINSRRLFSRSRH
jgi:predicted RNase H-like HicB family nuclease